MSDIGDAEVHHFMKRGAVCRIVQRVPPLHTTLDDPDEHIVIEEWNSGKRKWVFHRDLGPVVDDEQLALKKVDGYE